MSKRKIISFIILTFIFILFVGVYSVYEVFYSSYFNQMDYTQIASIGNDEIPTKLEMLFSGFKDLKVILISSLISVLIINGKRILNLK
ncbi:hypothetical protein [Flavobacterium sp.]|uniref:hypothetical protein n=1 Tax=Flavobacterium sp. TaxID=239 RepID=UPI00260A755A|nr:hypothetical protein [Flavobacterium sp.]